MSGFYLVVGWIIVCGFGITFIVTILALIKIKGNKIIEIEDKYMKILFGKLILEIIAAAFFIFFQGSTPTFEPKIEPKDVYLFDKHGEPIDSLKVLSGITTPKVFKKIPDTAFKEISRGFEISGDTLLIKISDNSTTFLGCILDAATKLQNLQTAEHALHLGLHLGEFSDETPGVRRDADNAIKYLKLALESGIEHPYKREEAIKRLYHLKDFFKDDDFKFLINIYDQNRKGNIKYQELADINYVASNRVTSKKERHDYRKDSLKNHLLYLKIQKPKDHNVDKLRSESKKQAKRLANLLSRADKISKAKSDSISTAVDNEDEVVIERFIDYFASK